MPPKGKKKRASLRLDEESGQITGSDKKEKKDATKEAPEKESAPVRQVVEVVDDDALSESIETIKKDVDEIEDAVEAVEAESLKEKNQKDSGEEQRADETNESDMSEDDKANVESLFVKSTSPVSPDITVVGKRGASLGVWVGATLGVVLAVGVSLIFFVRGPSTLPFLAPAPTPTPTETPAPTPTPVPELKRADVTVSVLNGGGVAGAGNKMKALLESKGYTVDNVGNADEFTHDETVINVKKGKEAAVSLLKEDLSTDYTVASETGTVADNAAYDAEVIVGKN